MSTPPPIPPRPNRSDEMLAAAAAGAGPAVPPPPKKGLSGCAIAAIVVGVLAVLLIVAVGILAAIAVPQYRQYIVRTRTTQAALQAETLQPLIDTYLEQSGRCPDNTAMDLPDAAEPVGPASGAEAVRVSTRLGERSGQCVIELRFESAQNTSLHDRTLLYVRDDNGWRCTGGTLPEALRPPRCRADTGAAP